MTRPKKKIAVTGNIGSGKTLVSRIIASFFDFDIYHEKVDKEVLNLYYTDMKKHGYNTQMFFIAYRFNDLYKMEIGQKSSVTDRYLDEDIEIFSTQLLKQGDLSKKDFNTIKKTKENLVKKLAPLDLLIYLQTDEKILKNRIKHRINLNPARKNETVLLDDDNPYLANLNILYDSWFKRYEGNKLLINTNNLTLANEKGEAPLNFGDIQKTLELIENNLYS